MKNMKKDVYDTDSGFWKKVNEEYNDLSHDDPGKILAIEANGMLKCICKERLNVISGMRNMISFYQRKATVLFDVIKNEDNADIVTFKPLLCSHYQEMCNKLDTLKHRFHPYINYFGIDESVTLSDDVSPVIDVEDLSENYLSDNDSISGDEDICSSDDSCDSAESSSEGDSSDEADNSD